MKTIKALGKMAVVSIFMLAAAPCISQTTAEVDLNARVKIFASAIRFDSLVDIISKQTKAQFSFNSGGIVPAKIVILGKGRYSLKDILAHINSSMGLSYKIVGSHIILLNKQPEINVEKPAGPYPANLLPAPKKMTLKKSDGKTSKSDFSKYHAKKKLVGDFHNRPAIANSLAADRRPAGDTVLPSYLTGQSIRAIEKISGSLKQKINTDTLISSDVYSSTENIIESSAVKAAARAADRGGSKNSKWTGAGERAKLVQYFAGVGVLGTVGVKDDRNANLYGLGLKLQLEKKMLQRLSAIISVGLNHFGGTYKVIYSFRVSGRDTVSLKGYTAAVLGLGGRYKWGESFYFAAEGGVLLKSKVNSGILFMIRPSVGMEITLKRKRKMDIGLKYDNVLNRSAHFNPVLETGGYGIATFGVAFSL